ncbi:hypothetical protein, partial [Mesorhizobium sp. M5C.F.Cr.IN.023.01.1.1]|uniref:hypothetical protein n=1 Tax=Mesorhizobium sp. M5C.F.Cr.IN.023.01.1.1 TaxID=2496768 RepID=UPI0019D0537E
MWLAIKASLWAWLAVTLAPGQQCGAQPTVACCRSRMTAPALGQQLAFVGQVISAPNPEAG